MRKHAPTMYMNGLILNLFCDILQVVSTFTKPAPLYNLLHATRYAVFACGE